MKAKIEPTSVIKVKLGIDPQGSVLKKLTKSCAEHMEKYVPKKTGQLRENIHVEPGLIIYQSDYAMYQYRGYTRGPVRNYTTPGTGPYWDKRMVSAELNDVIKEVIGDK